MYTVAFLVFLVFGTAFLVSMYRWIKTGEDIPKFVIIGLEYVSWVMLVIAFINPARLVPAVATVNALAYTVIIVTMGALWRVIYTYTK